MQKGATTTQMLAASNGNSLLFTITGTQDIDTKCATAAVPARRNKAVLAPGQEEPARYVETSKAGGCCRS